MKKEDVYIAILRYGKKHTGKPIKFSDMTEYLKTNGYECDDFAIWQLFAKVFISKESPMGNVVDEVPRLNHNFYLEDHGYFNLVQYEQLQDAKKSSKITFRIAIISIFISIITAILSIYFSNMQIKQSKKPINLDQAQFEKLDNDILSYKLDKILNEQEQFRNQIEKIINNLTQISKQD